MAQTILILAANPKDTSRLRLEEEVREIENGLRRAQKRDEFILKQLWAVRPIDVRRALLDIKPNIVHFCGHGEGQEGIVFENEIGNAMLVSAGALAGLFELFADNVDCVLLNACYSEIQAVAIAQHIDSVIGMKRDIGDKAAIEFAVAFYDALGAGESIEFAHRLACNAIQWADIPDHLTPILKLKTHSSKKVKPLQIVEPEKSHKDLLPKVNRKLSIMVSIISLSVVIVFTIILLQKSKTLTSPQKPTLVREKERDKTISDEGYPIELEENKLQKSPTPTKNVKVFINVDLNRNGAKVFVDSQFVGVAPCSIAVTMGLHELRLVYENILYGYTWMFRDTISVTSEKTIAVRSTDFRRMEISEKQ